MRINLYFDIPSKTQFRQKCHLRPSCIQPTIYLFIFFYFSFLYLALYRYISNTNVNLIGKTDTVYVMKIDTCWSEFFSVLQFQLQLVSGFFVRNIPEIYVSVHVPYRQCFQDRNPGQMKNILIRLSENLMYIATLNRPYRSRNKANGNITW